MAQAFSDTETKLRIAVEPKNDYIAVRIWNDAFNPAVMIEFTWPQFLRLMAFGEFLAHPRY